MEAKEMFISVSIAAECPCLMMFSCIFGIAMECLIWISNNQVADISLRHLTMVHGPAQCDLDLYIIYIYIA